MNADGGHVPARAGEPDGPAQVQGAGPGREQQASHPQPLGDPEGHVQLGQHPVEGAHRQQVADVLVGHRPQPHRRVPQRGRLAHVPARGRGRGTSWCRRSPRRAGRPAWGRRPGAGQGRVVRTAARSRLGERSPAYIDRTASSGGPGPAARQRKVGDPTRVIGSVNNRRLADGIVDGSRHGSAPRRPPDRPIAGSPAMSESGSDPGRAEGCSRRSTAIVRARASPGERPLRGGHPRLAAGPPRRRATGRSIERLGPGPMLDVGCGQGFESARFVAEDRAVVGVDYSSEAVTAARGRWGAEGLLVAQMDAAVPRLRRGRLRLGLLLAPDRALRGSRGSRPASWPGCWPMTGPCSSSPRTPRPTSRTPSTSTSSSRPSSAACCPLTSTTSACGARRRCPG